MDITKSQLNYIIAIKQLIGGEVSQKYICDYMGVKKSSASTALKNLEDNGYIIKQERGGIKEYSLSEKSWDIVESVERERFEFMSLFNGYLGIDSDLCQSEYDNLCGYFSKGFIQALSEIRKKQYRISDVQSKKQGFGIENGTYEISFQVVQGAEAVPSMGDRGFIHPARLVVDDDAQYIILEAKQIYYKSHDGQKLKGSLSRLYYSDSNMKWVLCDNTKDNIWIIPIEKIMCQRDNFGNLSIGIVKIKAEATTKKMPESTAEITFNFKNLKIN